MSADGSGGGDFIRHIVREDLAAGRTREVVTRFPPEPNGYLHIGHAFSMCLNFGVAAEFGGSCHLRLDDTNPLAEEEAYVRAIEEDVRWLGFEWDRTRYASDYFERMYDLAVRLIRRGKAFVCDLSSQEIEARRGSLTAPGRPSPYRDRPVEESLDLFGRMRAGEFENGERTLRARIDMASPNLVMRDPILYRVLKASHHRTGDAWCVYPMYDFAQSPADAFDGVTHSLCTLEFADHRPLYEWIVEQGEIEPPRPRQIEFAPLMLTHTVLSKRMLRRLVEEDLVSGWDDPRMPTLRGMRRRGYTPTAIRNLCTAAGVTRRDKVLQLAQLEAAVREDLNQHAPRAMAVLDPLRLVIANFPEGGVEQVEAINNPEDPSAGTRKLPFSRVLYIERDDFLEDPPRKFFRLAPGREVRLRYAYFVTCTGVVKDERGEIMELRCRYDPATRGGEAPDGRKVRGTLHWVSAAHAVEAEVRLYDVLFGREEPADLPEGGDWLEGLNPASLVSTRGWLEPGLAGARPGERFQFERLGYFCVDPDASPERPVFNRTVTLRDSWAKIAGRPRG